MVSINPGVQAYDFRHMYNFVDIRKEKTVCYDNNTTLMGIIKNNKDFSIFEKIVNKAGYELKLADKQSDYTVFVPSDEKLRMRYNQKYLDNIDKGFAKHIVSFSIMNRIIDKNLLQSSPVSIFPTIDRSNYIHIKTISDITYLTDDTKVIHFNQKADNGIIHVIDNLLIPTNSVY